MIAAERARPRDFIRCVRLGIADIPALAKLRTLHPGGPPEAIIPQYWVGAFEPGGGLVAAVGWIEEKAGMRMVVEVDRTPDHWGKVGVLVLIENLIRSSKQNGYRVQAMILPSNVKLKLALLRAGAKCVVEIFEAV